MTQWSVSSVMPTMLRPETTKLFAAKTVPITRLALPDLPDAPVEMNLPSVSQEPPTLQAAPPAPRTAKTTAAGPPRTSTGLIADAVARIDLAPVIKKIIDELAGRQRPGRPRPSNRRATGGGVVRASWTQAWDHFARPTPETKMRRPTPKPAARPQSGAQTGETPPKPPPKLKSSNTPRCGVVRAVVGELRRPLSQRATREAQGGVCQRQGRNSTPNEHRPRPSESAGNGRAAPSEFNVAAESSAAGQSIEEAVSGRHDPGSNVMAAIQGLKDQLDKLQQAVDGLVQNSKQGYEPQDVQHASDPYVFGHPNVNPHTPRAGQSHEVW